jgi:hypothetical protein
VPKYIFFTHPHWGERTIQFNIRQLWKMVGSAFFVHLHSRRGLVTGPQVSAHQIESRLLLTAYRLRQSACFCYFALVFLIRAFY